MDYRILWKRVAPLSAVAMVLLLLAAPAFFAQARGGAGAAQGAQGVRGAQGVPAAPPAQGAPAAQGGGGRGGARGGQRGAPPTAQAAAPIDLTGYWVALVTEDWRWRMVTPKKGDYPSIPLNAEGRRVADAWDPSKDQAAGDQCKAYGAGGIMRMPGRLHITWDNPNTLHVDADTGTQTRLFNFMAPQPEPGLVTQPASGAPTWQGDSAALWEGAGGRGGGGGRGAPTRGGDLKVVTTHMKPGYLQKNGVPYSGNAIITEYLHRADEPNGEQLLIVTTLTEDPQYLAQPHIRSSHFKKEPDGSKWNPTPCSAQ